MKDKKNVVLVDYACPNKWDFIKGLSESTNEEWHVRKLVSNMNHSGKVQNLIRYFKYFWLPLGVFFQRNKYKRVVSWQQFFGLILGFYCHLFHVKNAPDIYIMTFIYNRKISNFGKLYEKFIKYCITSKAVKKIIVFSRTEPEYYSEIFNVDKSLFSSTDLGIEDLLQRYSVMDNGRFLSAGRSNRDYEFLLKNWNKKRKLDIVCDSLAAENQNNISIFTSVHNDAFFKMLASCHAVVIGLKDENISSGQLVILQAMMMKKAVICTKNTTVLDYIDSGIDGVVINKSTNELEDAIKFVDENYSNLTLRAREKFESRYTEYQMGKNIGKLLEENK